MIRSPIKPPVHDSAEANSLRDYHEKVFALLAVDDIDPDELRRVAGNGKPAANKKAPRKTASKKKTSRKKTSKKKTAKA